MYYTKNRSPASLFLRPGRFFPEYPPGNVPAGACPVPFPVPFPLVHRLANTLAFERRCIRTSFVALLHHTQRYASVARLAGAAHRRSRCVKLFTRRYTRGKRKGKGAGEGPGGAGGRRQGPPQRGRTSRPDAARGSLVAAEKAALWATGASSPCAGAGAAGSAFGWTSRRRRRFLPSRTSSPPTCALRRRTSVPSRK